MKHSAIAIVCLFTLSCGTSVPVYKRADAPIEKRVEDLLSRMTLEEKILQMNQITLGKNLNENNIGNETAEPVLGSYITYVATDSEALNAMQHRAVEETRLGIPVLFGYDDIRKVSDSPLVFEVDVTNDSPRDGKETVHWYVSDPVCSVTRPYKELKFFEKRLIRSGATETFRFEVDKLRDLGYIDAAGDRHFEPGLFEILVSDKKLDVTLK